MSPRLSETAAEPLDLSLGFAECLSRLVTGPHGLAPLRFEPIEIALLCGFGGRGLVP